MRCLFALLAGCVLAIGCRSTQTHVRANSDDVRVETNFVVATRNNSVSLLYQLLEEEKHVSKLLIIKRDREELANVIENIARTAADGAHMLEEFAKQDATFALKATALPPGERAARDLQASATTRGLLHSKGADFEFKLLLSQAQALGYAESLAKVAAANENDTARRKRLNQLADELAVRHREVVALLRQQFNR